MPAQSFSYRRYNRCLWRKLIEVVPKKGVKYVLASHAPQLRRFFWERLGRWPQGVPPASTGAARFWMHANSLGEVNASVPLIDQLRRRYPGCRILMTTTNFSADTRARQLQAADAVRFFPYDVPGIIRRLLRQVQPHAVIILECDLWPNFLRLCAAAGVPVVVVSGIAVGRRSMLKRDLYTYRFLLSGEVLRSLAAIGVQTAMDAGALQALDAGLPVTISGNLKFAGTHLRVDAARRERLRAELGLSPQAPVCVAGNVHAEECAIVVEAFRQLRQSVPLARLLLAPRMLEAVAGMVDLAQAGGFSTARRTGGPNPAAEVIVLDTFGELAQMYGVGRAAFVGGSLVDLGDGFAGHNILEPAMAGVPVVFGPHMENVQSVADLFLDRGAAVQVEDAAGLAKAWEMLLTDAAAAGRLLWQAQRILEEQATVAADTCALIVKVVGAASRPGAPPVQLEEVHAHS